MAKKGAKGGGTIRKKTVTRSGKEYTYWEARVTVGRDPGSGKQLQRSFTGKTQREVREKMQAAAVEVNQGTYTEPSRMTVGQWLDIWLKEYKPDIKLSTQRVYAGHVNAHIKPALGAVKLSELHPHIVQSFINGLDYAPNTVHGVARVLHGALEKAVDLGYIPHNPSAKLSLPKLEQREVRPLDDDQVTALLSAARGSDVETVVVVALFTGMRISEIMGLTWDVIDFKRGTITVSKQLTQPMLRDRGLFQSPKNGKSRTLTPAASVMAVLRGQRARESEKQLRAGPIWSNPHGLVFTYGAGSPMNQPYVETHFHALAAAAGLEGFHFHDLRHTYAVNAIRAGDDIKTVQSNLGHASAAFTLDRYGHFTDRMAKDSAARMEGFMKGVLGL